jgi:hypothetical protein
MASELLTPPIEEVEWHWLQPHLVRGAIVVVAPEIELPQAAARIAADDTLMVSAWIKAGQLAKPALAQIEAWNAAPAGLFRMCIVQPYVLIQPRPVEIPEKE